MERQTSLFLIGVALLVCSATVFAQSAFVANFVEHKEGDEYGYVTGKVYYKYDGTCATVASGKPPCVAKNDRGGSRLVFQYDVGDETINNLYQYGDNAMYSMCSSSCSGILLTHKADPWYFDDKYYTKSADKEDGLYWYDRTTYGTSSTVSMDSDLVSPQVTRILMNEKAWESSDLIIKKIIFDDHRVVEFDVNTIKFETGHDSLFVVNPNLNCPKATCPIYADLVFVLDNSGSVDSSEWKQTVDFVKKVIDTFTFGEDAANAAVIQFNAPYTYNCGYNTVYYSCPTSSNPSRQCSCSKYARDCSFKSCSNPKSCADYFTGKDTASLIAGKNVLANVSDVSVSPDPISIKSNLTGKPSCYGNTCQGYGLELAIKVLDNSPRRRYGVRPQPIVIAVTDGVDFCPNKTYNAAEKLRKDYGALVIEVGVGMSTGCGGYDINFLKRVASKIGSEDNPAYYNVTNYNAIKELSDRLFKPICVGMDGACGPDCYGFCGCGKCLCPTCKQSHSSCYNVTCLADATSSTGCRRIDHPCPKDDKCNKYECQSDIYDEDKRCKHITMNEICKDMIEANKMYQCREVKCDDMEGCHVKYNDEMCNNLYRNGDMCIEYACAESDDLVDHSLGDTGCYLKTNFTQELEKEIENNGEVCFKAVCNPGMGAERFDLCPEMQDDNLFPRLCYTSECVVEKGEYFCKHSETKHDKDTDCSTMECDAKAGWVYVNRPDRNCTKELLDAHAFLPGELICMDIKCPHKGNDCTFTNMSETDGCDAYCNPSVLDRCGQKADSMSSDEECYHVRCKRQWNDKINDWEGICDEEVDYENCFENTALLNAIAERNGNGNVEECYILKCLKGKCDMNATTRPTDNNNKCLRYNCSFVAPGIYRWELVDSDEKLTCESNGCYERGCVSDKGCTNLRDICEKQSNKCFNLTCIRSNMTCKNESLLRESDCAIEICENGKPSPVMHEESCNLTEKYLCLERKCEYYGHVKEDGINRVGESKCVYTDKPEPQDDICLKYTCDNNTGEWNSTTKCVDDDLCTEDICNVFGQCRYPVITCEELSMDAYPCYYRQCIPDPENNKYMCKRRHIKGAMIDLCGNCIMEKEETGPVVVSDSMLMDSKYVHPTVESSSSSSISLISCTMAGPRPLLTEGLAAASIALIIIGAVVIGAGIAASGVIGTKTLIERARGANNQSAHTNPLFQENEAEMSNPAFIEEKDA